MPYRPKWKNQGQQVGQNIDGPRGGKRSINVDATASFMEWIPYLCLGNALKNDGKQGTGIEDQISPDKGMIIQ